MEFRKTEPWWTTDTYDIDRTGLPPEFEGPHGVATVWVNPQTEKTQPGWGLTGKDGAPGFMENYRKGRFSKRVTDHRYVRRGDPFAYVMRSLRLVCIDVDGKNGGYSSMPQLGHLPPTLTETSKSGSGIHLFYSTDEEWDPETGFALFDDRIGLATGIDVRATGCVYHHDTQRWNGRDIVPLPDFLGTKLKEAKERRDAAKAVALNIEEMDEMAVLVAQHEAEAELAKPLKAGSRNNTLFAIGTQLKLAAVPDWETKVHARAIEVGLGQDEADKLVANIASYGN